MNRNLYIVVIILLAIGVLTGCLTKELAEQREKQAGRGDNIIIGVPVPYDFAEKNTNFLKGIELALEEINSEGIDGKKIKLEIADDKGIFKNAVDIAQEFSRNSRMLAVIGHWFSDVCIPVSNIYEEAGMLVVVPTVSNPELMDKGHRLVFQNIPSDRIIAKGMSDYARIQGYQKVVIYYEESSYGRNLADAIETGLRENGIRVVDRTSGLITEMQMKKAYKKWNALDFDAILLALNMPEGADFIRELRKLDQDVAIISGDGLDVGNFIDLLGKDAEGIVISTIYSPDHQSPQLEEFTAKYVRKYNELPDVWAIQGYDSLMLIANAIKGSGSYSPGVIANYLREMEPLETVSGRISFNEFGEVQGREVYNKKVIDGVFEYVD